MTTSGAVSSIVSMVVLGRVVALAALARLGLALVNRPRPIPALLGPFVRPASLAVAVGVVATVLGSLIALLATYRELFPLDLYLWILLGALTSIEPRGSSPAASPYDRAAAASRPTYATS